MMKPLVTPEDLLPGATSGSFARTMRMGVPANGTMHYVTLIAGGSEDKYRELKEKLFKEHTLDARYHWDYEKKSLFKKPIPIDVEVVLILQDMLGTTEIQMVVDKAKAAGLRYVRGERKWVPLMQHLDMAGIPNQDDLRSSIAVEVGALRSLVPEVDYTKKAQQAFARMQEEEKQREQAELERIAAELQAIEETEQALGSVSQPVIPEPAIEETTMAAPEKKSHIAAVEPVEAPLPSALALMGMLKKALKREGLHGVSVFANGQFVLLDEES